MALFLCLKFLINKVNEYPRLGTKRDVVGLKGLRDNADRAVTHLVATC